MKREVATVFASYPPKTKARLMRLRRLILDVAARTEGVGPLEETLRWGQPSYLTERSGSGSSIRIDRVKSGGGQYAMYFHCQTDLVDTFRRMYRGEFRFEGNRAIVFDEDDPIQDEILGNCIALALTYHLRKRRVERRSR